MTVDMPDGDGVALTLGPAGPQGPPGFGTISVAVKTGDYTVTAEDRFLLGDATSDTVRFVLLAASTLTGHYLIFKKVDVGANPVIIVADGDDTIDGLSTSVLGYPNQAAAIVSDGANWQVVATNYGGTPVGPPLVDIVFDAVGDGFQAATAISEGPSLSPDPLWSHTIAGNAVVAFFSIQCNGGPGSDATAPTVTAHVGDTAMTPFGDPLLFTSYEAGGYVFGYWLYAFGLLNPPTGDQTLTISALPTVGFTRDMSANSVSFANVSSFGTPVTASDPVGGFGHAPLLSATVMTGYKIAQGFTSDSNLDFSLYSQTEDWNAAGVSSSGAGLPMVIGHAGGTSGSETTFSASVHNHPWAGIAIPVL
jgi:hypothetical protein